MNGNQAVISVSEKNLPSLSDRFLWWLATAETELIKDCVVDRNRYRIVGMSVLATWLFATMAWMYFFSTATNNVLAYVLLGFFMGFIILTIDRTLIKGISKTNKTKLLPLFFRGLMAIAIGTFMAQPAILYLFDKEIKLQASLDNEGRRMLQRKELDSLYNGQRLELTAQKQAVDTLLAGRYEQVNQARQAYISETDGSGGSGKLGISTIAMAKRAEYQKLDSLYRQTARTEQPKADSLQQQINSIEDSIQIRQRRFEALLNNGFLTRIQALQHLIKDNDALAMRYYLIVAILMLIELMPVIAKTLLPSGSYDEKLQLQEEKEKLFAGTSQAKKRAVNDYYNDAALSSDKQAIDDFFVTLKQHRSEKLKTATDEWVQSDEQSMEAFWQKVKKGNLS